jgi:hypothetical protein
MINLVKTILKFKSKQDALMFHLLAVSTEEGLRLSSGDIGVASEIYINGYDGDFFNNCVDKGFFKSVQTVRNSVAKLVKCRVVIKTRGQRTINPNYLPKDSDNEFIFNYQVNYDSQGV